MNLQLSAEAVEYGRQALRAFESAGGDELVHRAEAAPTERSAIAADVFDGLGTWDLDPRKDADELEAAAALCRAAGYWAVPYPVAERLSRPSDLDVDGLAVVVESDPVAAIAGVDLRWATVSLDGRRCGATALPMGVPVRTSVFAARLACSPIDEDGADDVALALVLPCWTLLGMLDRAIDLTRAHVVVRKQFGQRLADFQGVQFPLTDAEVERSGLDVLASYALWSIQSGRAEALTDALALRVAAIEAAELVFRTAHQLHGAIGFCDESPLSWLTRHSLPMRRLPLGLSHTRAELTRRIGRRGLTGLFGGGR